MSPSLQTHLDAFVKRVASEFKATRGLIAGVEDRTLSRGTDLVTNGTGYLKSNYNFPSLTYTQTDAPTGATGSFVSTVGVRVDGQTAENIPVDTTKTYKFSVAARMVEGSPTTGAVLYTLFSARDAFNNDIRLSNFDFRPGTTTTLAAPLNPGDTTMTLTSTAGWVSGTSSSHLRVAKWWDYVDPAGKAWPKETYTRVQSGNDFYTAIDGNVITLRVPYTGPARPAGTWLSNGSNASSYFYTAWNGQRPTSEWETRTAIIAGTATADDGGNNTGTSTERKFPPGTASIKIGWLTNYSPQAGANMAIGSISLSDASAAKDTADAAQDTATSAQTTADAAASSVVAIGENANAVLNRTRDAVGLGRRLAPLHLALASQDTTPCNIVVLGDSVSEGAVSAKLSDRWQSVLEKSLRSRPGGTGYQPAWFISPFVSGRERTLYSHEPISVAANSNNHPVQFDTDFTSHGFAAKRLGLQKSGWVSYQFTGPRLRLWYSRTTFFGLHATVHIDGIKATELEGTGADGGAFSWLSGDLGPGMHTVQVQERDDAVGSFWLEGFEVLADDHASGVHVYDGARSGARAEDYTGSGHPWPSSMMKVSPALVTMWFGYNDMNQRTPAQFKGDLQNVVNRINSTLAAGTYTLAIIAGWAPKPEPTATWEAYMKAMEEVATAHPYGVCIRIFDRWPDLTAGQDNLGMFGQDTVHPNEAGQRLIGRYLSDALDIVQPETESLPVAHQHGIGDIRSLEAELQDKADVSAVQDTGWVPIPLQPNWVGQARVRRNGNHVLFHVTDLNGGAVGSSLATLAVIPPGFRAPAGFTAHGVGATSSSTAVGAVAMTATSSGGGSGMSENVRVSTPSAWSGGAGSITWYTDEPRPSSQDLAALRGDGAQGGSIARSQIVTRSARWFPPSGPEQVPYSRQDTYPDGDGHEYRADCSGFISMALHADRSYSTRSLGQISVEITKEQLEAGDYLLSYDNHVVLFLGWTDETKTRYHARESSGPKGGTIAREIPYPYFEASSPETYVPMRYVNST